MGSSFSSSSTDSRGAEGHTLLNLVIILFLDLLQIFLRVDVRDLGLVLVGHRVVALSLCLCAFGTIDHEGSDIKDISVEHVLLEIEEGALVVFVVVVQGIQHDELPTEGRHRTHTFSSTTSGFLTSYTGAVLLSSSLIFRTLDGRKEEQTILFMDLFEFFCCLR